MSEGVEGEGEMRDGVEGLNSGAPTFGLKSGALALSTRGEPNGEDGAEEPELALTPLLSKACENGSV